MYSNTRGQVNRWIFPKSLDKMITIPVFYWSAENGERERVRDWERKRDRYIERERVREWYIDRERERERERERDR